jgi:hypothetical protein
VILTSIVDNHLPCHYSGHASVDAGQTLFLMDNVMNGFSLHRLDDAVCIRTYNTNPVKTFPKQVVFGGKATLVVGGSDTGVIYVFDKNEGTLKQVLQHADTGRVQTVTVRYLHEIRILI